MFAQMGVSEVAEILVRMVVWLCRRSYHTINEIITATVANEGGACVRELAHATPTGADEGVKTRSVRDPIYAAASRSSRMHLPIPSHQHRLTNISSHQSSLYGRHIPTGGPEALETDERA